jgi:hypothetical protein
MTTRSVRASWVTLVLAALLAPTWSCATKKNRSATASRLGGDERSVAARAPSAGSPTAPAAPSAPVQPATAPAAPPTRVLFIGNSYTFYNGGVDAVLAAMAKAKGRNIEATSVTSGGKTLEWHWENGDARAAIARGGWDYVVLQEFSTRPLTDADAMHRYARLFDAEIKNAGAKTVFYLTWARFHQPENQAVITRAYDAIAKQLNATVARVGPAFERVLERRPDLKLHMDDRTHPTPAGTYLAAAVFYATLTGDTAEGLPATVTTASGKSIELSPADASVLQRVANSVSARTTPTSVSD